MTGKFSEKDPERCHHYARFMSNISLAGAITIFWVLFVFVLVLMCVSSLQHHRSIAIGNKLESNLKEANTEEEKDNLRTQAREKRKHILGLVALCFVTSLTSVIFECFALFTIEFCHGEDLMQLYWGFWSVLQVGSLIAILGVMVQFWIVMNDKDSPSWAVALGTPVLVFAALGFLLHEISKQTWGRCTAKRVKGEDPEQGNESSGSETDVEKYDRETTTPMSQAPTIVTDAGAAPRDGPGRTSTFWSRDLHHLLNSVAREQQKNRQS